MKFIHLTDPHLVPRGGRLHGLDPAARLEACVRHVAAHHGDAAFCVLTGDVADSGRPAAYDAAREILDALPMPVHVLPGNHDDRASLLARVRSAPRDADGFVQSAFEHEGAWLVLLDTLDRAAGSGGRLCERRERWLEDRLAAAGDAPVYLFMHHPPFPIGMPGLDRIGLAGADRFASIVEAAGNVRHVFFGHVHRPVSGQWRGISFSTLYGTSHQIGLDFSGAERLAYTAEPPAYAVVLADAASVVVHTCHFASPAADIRDPDERHPGT